MEDTKEKTGPPATLPLLGVIASLMAFVGASCCVLPLVLAMLGLGGAWIANLAIFVIYRYYIISAAALIILVGWFIALKHGANPQTYFILGVATLIITGTFFLMMFETQINRYLITLWQDR